jgi:hypothetical protein
LWGYVEDIADDLLVRKRFLRGNSVGTLTDAQKGCLTLAQRGRRVD